jgi:hypothetical protein
MASTLRSWWQKREENHFLLPHKKFTQLVSG